MNVYRHRKIFSDNMLNHVNQKISYNSLNGLLQYWDIIKGAKALWISTTYQAVQIFEQITSLYITKPFNHALK